jgi:hypothetical protein
MQKSRTQHRKAVTLDTAVWPFSDTRVDKLENDVKGIRSDVSDIKDSVDRLTGVKNVGDDGDRDVDEGNNHDESQDDPGDYVVEKNGKLTKLQTEIQESEKQIDETVGKFAQEMQDLQLRHNAALHQMETHVEEKKINAAKIQKEIHESTNVNGTSMPGGVSSTASQYCVNLTR